MAKVSLLIRLLAITIATLFLTIACSQQPKAQPLTSGLITWVGYSGHYVSVAKDFFAQEGVKVQERYFQSGSEEIKEFLDGKLDLGWTTSGDAIQMMDKDPSIKIIYVADYSNGADGIVGRGIKSPKDAKGKAVSRENILYERVLLRAYLEKAALSEKDVTIKDAAGPEAAANDFIKKEASIAVTFEPYLSKAVKEGGGEILFSTKNTSLIADVIVARDPLIKSRRAELQAYLRAVDKAVKLVNQQNPEALKIVGAKLRTSTEEVKAQLESIQLFDVEGNKSIGFDKINALNIVGNLDLTARAGFEFKFITKPLYLDVNRLYDDSIVQSL